MSNEASKGIFEVFHQNDIGRRAFVTLNYESLITVSLVLDLPHVGLSDGLLGTYPYRG